MQPPEIVRDYMTNENLFLSWVRNGAILIVAGLAFTHFNMLYATLIVALGASFISYSGVRYFGIKAVIDKKETSVLSSIPIRIFGIVGGILSIGLVIILLLSVH